MNKAISAVLADDEQVLRLHLRRLLTRLWPELVICGEAENGIEAARLIEEHIPDIAFLDIRMPGQSGLEVAARVPEQCQVVFITAYDEYAIAAFEKEALDYLLKPVTEDRLGVTIARLQKKFQSGPDDPGQLERVTAKILRLLAEERNKEPLQWLRVEEKDHLKLLPVADVLYFQASDKYTLAMTGKEEYLLWKTIRQLAAELDTRRFWQIHRKTIVNADRIAKVGRSLTGRFVVHLKDQPTTLTVSRSFRHLFARM
ncbi:MAG: LytR/AlgR family response regulator transcription factor [Desulfobulbaceae bacterium]